MDAISNARDMQQMRDSASKHIIYFVNIAHAIDHFVLLIYPTAVIALAASLRLDYATLISLATGAFVAFGVLSLPVGFAAGYIGRRNLMVMFFFGVALTCFGMASANSTTEIAVWLLLLGCFAGIYHPVGAALLIANAPAGRLGHTLGVNGIWGNLGAASAPVVTAALAYAFGWRSAFLVPALIACCVGIAFVALVPATKERGAASAHAATANIPRAHLVPLLAAFMVLVICAGATFNILTIALPKIVDERLGFALPIWLVGSIATILFICGAISQFNIGRLIETRPLPRLLLFLAVLQPLGFLMAAFTTGPLILVGLAMAVVAIFGNVVIVDAIIGRYVPDRNRARVYGVRYFLSFAASGFAVPVISWLYSAGGFSFVLFVSGGIALVLLACAALIFHYHTESPASTIFIP